jgi:uncharacterized membrane protein
MKKQHFQNHTTPRTWHQQHEEASTFGERMADTVAEFMGSWPFIISQTAFVLIWMTLNVMAYMYQWDPYPFILLNLVFSVQAAYAAPVIMMAQNRQNERDRIQAYEDYRTNIEAKLEIESLQKEIARIETEKLDLILQKLGK